MLLKAIRRLYILLQYNNIIVHIWATLIHLLLLPNYQILRNRYFVVRLMMHTASIPTLVRHNIVRPLAAA